MAEQQTSNYKDDYETVRQFITDEDDWCRDIGDKEGREKCSEALAALDRLLENRNARITEVYSWLDQANYKKNEYLARAEKAEAKLKGE